MHNSSVHKVKCVVVTRFAKSQPGYLDFAYRIRALASAYRVTVLSDHELHVPEMQIEGVNHVVLEGNKSGSGLAGYLLRSAWYVRKARPELVILLHTLTAPMIYALQGIPHALYWNEHPVRFKDQGQAGVLKQLFMELKYRVRFITPARIATLVMPIGEAHRDYLLAVGCRPERLKLIDMGVDDAFAGVALGRERANADAPLELIYTGSVMKERGRDVMLEGLAKACWAGVPVRLTMVGARPEELAYCQSFAKKLGIEGSLAVNGRVPGSEVPSFIAAADAGICIWEDRPWWRFNPPTKLFEYLVAGLPVLASNIRTHTEYVRHGENGLIFEYDSDSFALAIEQFWCLRADLSTMKRRAYDSGQVYLWSNIEPSFLEAVAAIAGKHQ